MTQANIIIGAADAKTGDTYFDAFTKTQSNFTQLFKNNTVYLNQESDLPNQTATTWTMDENIPYKLTGSFSTSLQCIPSAGSSFRGDNVGSFTLSYTGTGAMFKGVDVDFFIRNVSIDPGVSNMAFDFIDTVGGKRRFICTTVVVESCAVFGEFTDMALTELFNTGSLNAGDGVRLFGTNNNIWSFDKVAFVSTNTGFKGIDLGTATATVIELSNLFFVAPAAAFGISGLANSGNVPVGSLAMVDNSEFIGLTPLENINQSDVRWDMQSNTPIPDSRNAADVFLIGGSETITTGSAGDWQEIGVPSAGGVSWSSDIAERFTIGTNGVITYIGERNINIRMSGRATVEKVGGGSDVIEGRFAINWDGTVSDGGLEKSRAQTQSADPTTIPIGALFTLSPGDNIRPIFSNITGTSNIIASVSAIEVIE